jgi:PBP1b-binding outer membrane lipoprotein LpoB
MKISIAMLAVLLLGGCQTQGPFERAGKNIDDTIENVREGTQDVIEDVREGAEDVRDDVTRRR